MHFRTFITFDKSKAENSEIAREYVKTFLIEENFCNQGFFSNSPADWFVIGGRWSGELQDIDIYKKVMKMLKKKKDEHLYQKDLDSEENKKEIQKIWEKEGGKGINPLIRDNYNDNGYEDDAMVVTKTLYNKFLKELKGKETDNEHFWDLEYDCVDKKFIGNKWIVMVDYHN